MDRISIDPFVHFGKPCIKGTRIKVQDIFDLLKKNVTFEQITQIYYPDIKAEDIQACLHYAILQIDPESDFIYGEPW